MNTSEEIKKYVEEIKFERTSAYTYPRDQDFSVAQTPYVAYNKKQRFRISLEKALFDNIDNPSKTKEIMSTLNWEMPLLLSPVVHHESYTQVSEESPQVMPLLIAVLRSENQHAIALIPTDKKLSYFNRTLKNSGFWAEIENVEIAEKLAGFSELAESALRNAASSFLVFAEDPETPLLSYWLSKLYVPKLIKEQKNPSDSHLEALIGKIKPQIIKKICEKALMDNQVFELLLPCARSLLRCGYFLEFAELMVFANQNLEKDQLVRVLDFPIGAQMEPWIEIIAAHKKVVDLKDEYLHHKWDDMLQIIPQLHSNGRMASFVHIARNDKEKLWSIFPTPGDLGFACMALDFNVDSEFLYDETREEKAQLFRSRKELGDFLRQCVKSYIEKEAPKIEAHEKAWRFELEKKDASVMMRNLGKLWKDCVKRLQLSNEESEFAEKKAIEDLIPMDMNEKVKEKRKQLCLVILPMFKDAILNHDLLANIKSVNPTQTQSPSPPKEMHRF